MHWFNLLVLAWIGVALIVFLVLVVTKIRAPYGRHTTDQWGKMISNNIGWFVMELPALLITPVLAITGPSQKDWLAWLLIGLWLTHYINRTVIFPMRIRTKGKRMPLTIVFSAMFFNGMNGFVNGYFLGYIYTPDPERSFLSPEIIAGLVIFFTGMTINHMADNKLISLRKQQLGYQIPRGWLFEYISCPNHFGEIIEWIGYAVVAWNLPAVSFAVWTFCNLVPRTLNHHAWYREHFQEYPQNRRAVIPYLL